MAGWERCPYCGQQVNGWERMQAHKRTLHPIQFAREELAHAVRMTESLVDREQSNLTNYEDYAKALAMDLPPRSREVLEGLRSHIWCWCPVAGLSQPYKQCPLPLPDCIPLHVLPPLAERLRDAVAALAAFDREHPPGGEVTKP